MAIDRDIGDLNRLGLPVRAGILESDHAGSVGVLSDALLGDDAPHRPVTHGWQEVTLSQRRRSAGKQQNSKDRMFHDQKLPDEEKQVVCGLTNGLLKAPPLELFVNIWKVTRLSPDRSNSGVRSE